ncbi:hypothetical protein XENOCAPTIV_006478 [Xenoophorus captivus]|uniref:DNA 3'-5' helicase n=1 Tax=Xenoophorus captivus TaxID=1517983 RepID=A0ABV0RW41_9TELE
MTDLIALMEEEKKLYEKIDFDLCEYCKDVVDYVQKKFADLGSPNKLKITMGHGAKAWVSDFNHPHYMAGRKAMKTGLYKEYRSLKQAKEKPVSLKKSHRTGRVPLNSLKDDQPVQKNSLSLCAAAAKTSAGDEEQELLSPRSLASKSLHAVESEEHFKPFKPEPDLGDAVNSCGNNCSVNDSHSNGIGSQFQIVKTSSATRSSPLLLSSSPHGNAESTGKENEGAGDKEEDSHSESPIRSVDHGASVVFQRSRPFLGGSRGRLVKRPSVANRLSFIDRNWLERCQVKSGQVCVLLLSPEALVGGGGSGSGCLPSAQELPPVAFASRKKIRKPLKWQAEAYHAGLSGSERRRVQNNFMCGELRIVVATVAFGMGLDKSDVRGIIHYNMPKSFESYVQEIGRAGRDGEPAHCHLFLDPEVSHLNLAERSLQEQKEQIEKKKEGKDKGADWQSGQKGESCDWPEERVCHTHERAIPIQETIEALDITEEVAVVLARRRMAGERVERLNEVEFDVVEVADTMGWQLPMVKRGLRQLQWSTERGGGRSGILVEFSSPSFYFRSYGDLSDEEMDRVCQFLYNRVQDQERTQLYQLTACFKAFKRSDEKFSGRAVARILHGIGEYTHTHLTMIMHNKPALQSDHC